MCVTLQPHAGGVSTLPVHGCHAPSETGPPVFAVDLVGAVFGVGVVSQAFESIAR